jgi:hypothetical protein
VTVTTVLGDVPVFLADIAGWVAKALLVGCVIPVIIKTIRRKAFPSPVMWGLWGALGTLTVIALIRGGASWQEWTAQAALKIGPILVCIVALIMGVPWRATRRDRVCLLLGIIGTIIYAALGAGAAPIAIITAIVVDIIASIPTLGDIWIDPYKEIVLTYVLALGSVIVVFLFLPWPWTLWGTLYLGFIGLQMYTIIVDFVWARHRLRKAEREKHKLRPV